MKIKTELHEYAQRRSETGPYVDNLEVDALVVGGGFGGIYCWYELKKAGFKTVIYEAGDVRGPAMSTPLELYTNICRA